MSCSNCKFSFIQQAYELLKRYGLEKLITEAGVTIEEFTFKNYSRSSGANHKFGPCCCQHSYTVLITDKQTWCLCDPSTRLLAAIEKPIQEKRSSIFPYDSVQNCHTYKNFQSLVRILLSNPQCVHCSIKFTKGMRLEDFEKMIRSFEITNNIDDYVPAKNVIYGIGIHEDQKTAFGIKLRQLMERKGHTNYISNIKDTHSYRYMREIVENDVNYDSDETTVIAPCVSPLERQVEPCILRRSSRNTTVLTNVANVILITGKKRSRRDSRKEDTSIQSLVDFNYIYDTMHEMYCEPPEQRPLA